QLLRVDARNRAAGKTAPPRARAAGKLPGLRLAQRRSAWFQRPAGAAARLRRVVRPACRRCDRAAPALRPPESRRFHAIRPCGHHGCGGRWLLLEPRRRCAGLCLGLDAHFGCVPRRVGHARRERQRDSRLRLCRRPQRTGRRDLLPLPHQQAVRDLARCAIRPHPRRQHRYAPRALSRRAGADHLLGRRGPPHETFVRDKRRRKADPTARLARPPWIAATLVLALFIVTPVQTRAADLPTYTVVLRNGRMHPDTLIVPAYTRFKIVIRND